MITSIGSRPGVLGQRIQRPGDQTHSDAADGRFNGGGVASQARQERYATPASAVFVNSRREYIGCSYCPASSFGRAMS